MHNDMQTMLGAGASVPSVSFGIEAESESHRHLLLAQPEDHHQRQNARQRKEQQAQQHQASSNQSRSSSASSASVSSSPSSSPHSRSSPFPSRPERRREKRKSITRTPVAGLANSSAIAAALEAGSVAVAAAPPLATTGTHGGLLGLSAHRRLTDALYDGRTLDGGTAALLLGTRDAKIDGTSDDEVDVPRRHKDSGVKNLHLGVIDTRRLQRQTKQTKLHHTLDKMLSERIYDRKKYLNSPTGGSGATGGVGSPTSAASAFYEKFRNGAVSGDSGESQLNLIKNALLVDATRMRRWSRSVTPSSFSGTPPQTMHPNDASYASSISTSGLLPSPNSSTGLANSVGRSAEFQTRNYSDFMRSLAAKYNNNNNTNDVSNIKNSFLEPKMRYTQPKSFIESSLNSKKGSPLTSTQVPNPSIMTTLFSGLPFQSAVFPPLIDMSSTQALVTLVDTGGGLKKPSSLSRGSSPPPSTGIGAHPFPSPFTAGYLPGLLPNHHPLASFPAQPSPSATGGTLKSPSRAPEPSALVSTFPLDLSATTPSGSKRIKLSPTPSRHQETSPAPSSTNSQPSADSLDLKSTRKCHARVEEISAWTVDNVCDFVASIDICAEYVQLLPIETVPLGRTKGAPFALEVQFNGQSFDRRKSFVWELRVRSVAHRSPSCNRAQATGGTVPQFGIKQLPSGGLRKRGGKIMISSRSEPAANAYQTVREEAPADIEASSIAEVAEFAVALAFGAEVILVDFAYGTGDISAVAKIVVNLDWDQQLAEISQP
uniref:Uncharacterized protein n=1 Tax=Anopheles farauti TaxID=69004 RepID=A0A182QXZ3_9DIPT